MANVAVVLGGRSLEREISLRSGGHVAAALRHLGHAVTELDVDESLTASLARADVAFLALHGRDGEDGTIQSLLEALGVSYTGSNPVACQLTFDKAVAKGLLRVNGIATPESYVIPEEGVRHMGAGVALRAGAQRLGFPLVVKPVNQGSALGLAVVHEAGELGPAVMNAFNFGERVLLERYVDGREFAVGVLGPTLRALPPVEIVTKGEVFGFESRPTVSPGAVEYVCPADLPAEVSGALTAIALEAAAALGVRDFGRVDLMLRDDREVLVLDLKTCPGLTETSLVPAAAAAAGLSFDNLVAEIVAPALHRA